MIHRLLDKLTAIQLKNLRPKSIQNQLASTSKNKREQISVND